MYVSINMSLILYFNTFTRLPSRKNIFLSHRMEDSTGRQRGSYATTQQRAAPVTHKVSDPVLAANNVRQERAWIALALTQLAQIAWLDTSVRYLALGDELQACQQMEPPSQHRSSVRSHLVHILVTKCRQVLIQSR